MRAVVFLLGLVAVLAACAGDGGGDTNPAGPLTEAAFADKAAAAIVTQTELQATPGSEPAVSVFAEHSLDVFKLRLREAYRDYRADPGRLDAVLREVVQEAEATMERGNAERSFADVEGELLPLLQPVPALRELREEPATTTFPGNLRVVYLVQRGDSVTAVTGEDLERWQRSIQAVHRAAVANLLAQTNRDEPLRCEQELCGWASGDGFDAARMIVPELRRQIVREIGPTVHAVPTEGVYVALPIRLADRIRPRVEQQFVTGDDPVSQDLFVERGGRLVVLRR